MKNAKVLQDKLSCFLKKEESLENLYNFLKNDTQKKETNPEELEKILKEFSKEYEWITIDFLGQVIEKQGAKKFIENLTKIRLEEMIKIKNNLIAFLNGRFLSLYDALSWHIENLDEENKCLKENLDEENKCLKTEIKHKNQLWKSAFRAFKNLKKQMKKEILELRDAFDTMKLLAIPKAYIDGDYLSTTVLKICNEALKDTEKYVKEGEK